MDGPNFSDRLSDYRFVDNRFGSLGRDDSGDCDLGGNVVDEYICPICGERLPAILWPDGESKGC